MDSNLWMRNSAAKLLLILGHAERILPEGRVTVSSTPNRMDPLFKRPASALILVNDRYLARFEGWRVHRGQVAGATSETTGRN